MSARLLRTISVHAVHSEAPNAPNAPMPPQKRARVEEELAHPDTSDDSDPEGTIGKDRVPERPRRSCSVNVPSTGRVPAGEDLPNWTVERADALDGRSFLLYRNPKGQAVGSRKAALTCSGQLELPESAYVEMGEVLRENRRHQQRLRKRFALSSALAKYRQPPNRPRIDYDQLVRSRLAPPSKSAANDVVLVDLYCGLGGLSLGLKAAGFSHIGGVDKCPTAVGIFNENACGSWGLCRRIRPTERQQWLAAFKDAGLVSAVPCILVGGPPCQPYSQSGMRMGGGDERDGIARMIDLAIDVRPLAVLVENVPTLLDTRFAKHVQTQFERLRLHGYTLAARIHGGWEHSVPQLRRRLVVIALRDDAWQTPPPIDLFLQDAESNRPIILPWDALANAEEGEHLWKGACPADLKIDGISLRSRERIATPTQTAGLIVAGRPCPTVLTTCLSGNSWQRLVLVPTDCSDKPNTETYGNLRMLNANHVKRLQSFPSDFKLYGHPRMQGLLLGNAVPPLMANDIGRQLARAISMRRPDGSNAHLAKQAALRLKAAVETHIAS